MPTAIGCGWCKAWHYPNCHYVYVSDSFQCPECGYFHVLDWRGDNCPSPETSYKRDAWSRRNPEFYKPRNELEEKPVVARRDIEGRKRALQERIDAAAEELALLQKFDSVAMADFPVGATLRWTSQGSDSNRTVLYFLAVKQGDDAWSISVERTQTLSQIIDTIVHDGITEVEVATAWGPLDENTMKKLEE